jgi:hypothetical protein
MKRISDDLAGILTGLKNLPPLDDEAAWAERDQQTLAAIAAEAAKARREGLAKRARQLVADFGFPPRAMTIAEQVAVARFERRQLPPAAGGPPTEPVNTLMLDAARAWVSSGKPILVLAGSYGTGKTVAACALALASQTERWTFLRAAELARSSRYARGERDEVLAGGMVLDDLGAEYLDGKGSFLVDLDELVDSYYANGRPLVITTNASAKTFKERYQSDRLISRLREAALWREEGAAVCLRPEGGQ